MKNQKPPAPPAPPATPATPEPAPMLAQRGVKSIPKPTSKEYRNITRAGKGNWQQRFIAALSDIPNVTYACDTARIHRITAYKAREVSKRFRDQWEKALTVGTERLELAAYDRARNGIEENVWMKDENGKPVKVDSVRRYSDTLAIFLLKAHNPAKYREPREFASATVTSPDGTSMSITMVRSPIDPEEVTGPAPVGLLKE